MLDAVFAVLGQKRVVGAQLLEEAAVAGHAAVGGDDAVEGTLFRAAAGQSDFHCHWGISLDWQG
jgi:hypothetical protein